MGGASLFDGLLLDEGREGDAEKREKSCARKKRTEQVNVVATLTTKKREREKKTRAEGTNPPRFKMSSGGPFRKFSLSDVSTQNSVKSSVQRGIRGAATSWLREAFLNRLSISIEQPPWFSKPRPRPLLKNSLSVIKKQKQRKSASSTLHSRRRAPSTTSCRERSKETSRNGR